MATMKSAEASDYGSVEFLEVTSTRGVPVLDPDSSQLLVRVGACSLSPGDWRNHSGEAKAVRKPKNGFPWVPGADICGTVEAVGKKAAKEFQVGDQIIGTWEFIAEGGLAEYALVDMAFAAKARGSMDVVEGAALANSAVHAMHIVKQAKIQQGDRVLVLGGSGGVGTIVLQLVKNAGAGFVATTSTQSDLVLSLGADECVDHTKQEWSEHFTEAFDVIIDCAEGVKSWHKACSQKLLKRGWRRSRFVGVILKEWKMDLSSWGAVGGLFAQTMGRSMRTSAAFVATPSYSFYVGGSNGKEINKVLDLVEQGKIRVVVDSDSPHPLTTEGVQAAFQKLGDRKGHGKIVVKID